MPGILVDTNVLIYLYDSKENAKRRTAASVVDAIWELGDGYLTTQVLGEFYTVALRKLTPPLSPREAAEEVEKFIEGWLVCDVTVPTVREAVRGAAAHQLAYYDALIWATAKMNQISNILTEDGQHNRVIEGVRYLNPFAPGFDAAVLSGI